VEQRFESSRDPLARGMAYPVQASPVRQAFGRWSDAVYFRSSFTDHVKSWARGDHVPSAQLASLERRLPEHLRYWISRPWDECDDPAIIELNVYSVPASVLRQPGARREACTNALVDSIIRWAPPRLTDHQWRIELWLDADEPRLRAARLRMDVREWVLTEQRSFAIARPLFFAGS
jgi:hypothetical protein